MEFEKFFANYGTILKEGIYYEHDLKEDIAEVCLWESMDETKKISLEKYLEKQKSHTKPHHNSSPQGEDEASN